MRRFLSCATLWLSVLAILLPMSSTILAEETQRMYFFAKLLPLRPGFPDSMTTEEEKVMGEHFEYCKRLTMEKSMVMAGPCMNPTFGLFIISAKSIEAASEIVKQDPSVVAGIHKFEIQPFYLSLLMQNVSPLRYPSPRSDKAIHKTITVSAPIADVWKAWTTSEGVNGFLGVRATVELRVGGKYEWLFDDKAPEGQAGSEDCKVLSYLPEKMLSFEWNAPPTLPNARRQRTVVVILFDEKTPGQTTIDFTQFGFGMSEEWDKTFEYFNRAWGQVLSAYQKSLGKK